MKPEGAVKPEEERELLGLIRLAARLWFVIGITAAIAGWMLHEAPWCLLSLAPWSCLQAAEIRQWARVRRLP